MSKRASARTGAGRAATPVAVEAKPETAAPLAAPAAAAAVEPVAAKPVAVEAKPETATPLAAPAVAAPVEPVAVEAVPVEALPVEPIASQDGEAEFDLDASAVLVVRGPQRGRYRAGRHFAREEVRIPASDLDEGQVAAILGDPELTVVIEQDAR